VIPVINRRLADLREALEEPFDAVPDYQLGLVIERVGFDVDLAAAALTMIPRPAWVELLVGTAPASGE
jgi:hypothetical protein